MNNRRLIGAFLIGLACSVVEPETWRSMVSAVLLVVALNLYLWDVRTRP